MAVAKEAVTASAKARGGTNGWGGNRTSCWSCWQKVLVVVVVWLVVPAEAVGAAQVAGGMAAAAVASAQHLCCAGWRRALARAMPRAAVAGRLETEVMEAAAA